MRKRYQRDFEPATAKSRGGALDTLRLECQLPLAEFIDGIRDDVEALSAELGLKIMLRVMDEEIASRVGAHGRQSHYRHGTQAGYVVFAGRKVRVERPRMRTKEGAEADLESYGAFQKDGRMQKAVSRQLIARCSTRDYAGAIDDCLEGYGVKKSSVSRHWKAATAKEMETLCRRPVPQDLVVLLIDGKHFKDHCVVVAVGVDKEGKKHVLGLWDGASENATVVKNLLSDLVERGLDTERPILVVIDGAKALAKAVRESFGAAAFIQRCRVHKQRNVLDHLAKDKQGQALWRLRQAWAEPDYGKALRKLKEVVAWLEELSVGAARSLEEGMEETLTLQRLGIPEALSQSLSSTNLIESCFSRAGEWMRRVKTWRNARMVLRWSAAALLVAERGFRRVKGHRHLPLLCETLRNHQENLATRSRVA